jgi:NTP pyrophosphatase (non-canonical NTP hydrolase)
MSKTPDLEDYIEMIADWGIARNIVEGSTPSAQVIKTLEECVELIAAIHHNDTNEIRDAIGDVIVTLVMISEQTEIPIIEAVEHAYNEIKDRKGTMRNGIFYKKE